MPIGGIWNCDPVLAKHSDGRLEVLAVGMDGRLYAKSQAGPSQAFIPNWIPFSSDFRVWFYYEEVFFDPVMTQVSCALDGDSKMCVFLRSTRGRTVFARHHFFPDGWSGWSSIAATQDGHRPVGNPVASSSPLPGGGRQIQVAVRSRLNEILLQGGIPDHGRQDLWSTLGSHISADPVLVSQADGSTFTTSIYARGVDGALWWNGERVRTSGSLTGGTPYNGLRRAFAGGPPGSALAGQPVAPTPENVTWRGVDGNLWTTSWTSFGSFRLPSSLNIASASDPAIAIHGGNSWLFWIAPDGQLMMRRRRSGGPNENPVSLTGGSGVRMRGRPSASTSADGRVEVVCVGGDGAMYHFYETGLGTGTFGEGP